MAYSDDFIENLLNSKKLAQAKEAVKKTVKSATSSSSKELNKLFKETKNIASAVGNTAKKQATKEVAKKVGARALAGGTSLGAGTILSPLMTSGLIGSALGEYIRNKNISFPIDKKKQQEVQDILNSTNATRIEAGLPEIDVYGRYVSKNPQRRENTLLQQQPQQQTSINSDEIPPIDSIGVMINKLQNGENISNIPSGAKVPSPVDLPSIEDINTAQVNQPQVNMQDLQEIFDNILALKQASAQQRQGIYKPELDYLQKYINEYNKASEWQARQSAIASGLAGFADNPYIYKAVEENDPRKQMAGLEEVLGKQAQLRDALRYDPSQVQADAQLAISEGFSPLLSVGSKDVVNAIAMAKKMQDANSVAQLKLLLDQTKINQENERYQNQLKQQNLDNMFKLMGLKLQEDKINKQDLGKLLPETAVAKISNRNTAIKLLEDFDEKINSLSPTLKDPIKGRLATLNPYSKEAQIYQQLIKAMKQIIGKGLEEGVLRKEDEYKYEQILPKIGDTEAILRGKSRQLNDMIKLGKNDYIQTLKNAGYDVSKFEEQQTQNAPKVIKWRVVE